MAVVALGRSALAVPALLYFTVAYALATVAAFGVVVELRGRLVSTRWGWRCVCPICVPGEMRGAGKGKPPR